MSKSKYEVKTTMTLIGMLDKNKDGRYVVSVEHKDSFKEYDVIELLDSLCGYPISITSES